MCRSTAYNTRPIPLHRNHTSGLRFTSQRLPSDVPSSNVCRVCPSPPCPPLPCPNLGTLVPWYTLRSIRPDPPPHAIPTNPNSNPRQRSPSPAVASNHLVCQMNSVFGPLRPLIKKSGLQVFQRQAVNQRISATHLVWPEDLRRQSTPAWNGIPTY